MALIICHHNGKYNIYTTIADGFIYESALTLEQLKEAIKEQGGNRALERLPERLKRAHKNGHSGNEGGDLDSFLCCNRAGEDEEHLTTEECIARFLT